MWDPGVTLRLSGLAAEALPAKPSCWLLVCELLKEGRGNMTEGLGRNVPERRNEKLGREDGVYQGGRRKMSGGKVSRCISIRS